MADIGKEIEIVEIPEPLNVPDRMPEFTPVQEPEKVPA